MNQLSITTTQNVTINFTSAGIGERILAQLLDFVVLFVYCIVATYFMNHSGLSDALAATDYWSSTAVNILIFSPALFYTLCMESFWEGQTLGKRVMRIKVIKLDGYQASFGDYLIRWLFSIIDVALCFGIIGLIVMATNAKGQRLGDMGAGTAVISLKNKININQTILQELEDDYVPVYPEVIQLSDNDMRIIKDTYETCVAAKDFVTISKMRTKIVTVTGLKYKSESDVAFMKTIIKDYNYYTRNM